MDIVDVYKRDCEYGKSYEDWQKIKDLPVKTPKPLLTEEQLKPLKDHVKYGHGYDEFRRPKDWCYNTTSPMTDRGL